MGSEKKFLWPRCKGRQPLGRRGSQPSSPVVRRGFSSYTWGRGNTSLVLASPRHLVHRIIICLEGVAGPSPTLPPLSPPPTPRPSVLAHLNEHASRRFPHRSTRTAIATHWCSMLGPARSGNVPPKAMPITSCEVYTGAGVCNVTVISCLSRVGDLDAINIKTAGSALELRQRPCRPFTEENRSVRSACTPGNVCQMAVE